MPVTWCYIVEDGSTYCSRGFPLGCFVNSKGKQKDSCIMSPDKVTIRYTYSVSWQLVISPEDKHTRWSSRWDYILESMPHNNIQWHHELAGDCADLCFSIMNLMHYELDDDCAVLCFSIMNTLVIHDELAGDCAVLCFSMMNLLHHELAGDCAVLCFSIMNSLHHELAGDCAVPVRHGGHDNAGDSPQGHRQIQPD
ncbi:hypothetical protein DPMN_138105 [Dreissena polymorpha]|uniref:Uncharacterized protein n=1 Tax=Dreissena polymorpha TaxID=45954 RepID=A0A9D4G604_DREPO|nr:hypothetical protein DPMN_138105 [Dreissena polymorpha]